MGSRSANLAMWPLRSKPLRVAMVAAFAIALLAVLPAPSDARGRSVVPVGPDKGGFGKFKARSANSSRELKRAFGKPDSAKKIYDGLGCNMRWRSRGVVATLIVFGEDDSRPCRKGTFVRARLTKRRWHTPSGVHPGSSRRKARRNSVRKCNSLGACGGPRGFALGLFRNECAGVKTPTVIAQVPKGSGRVKSLIVRWRGCE